MTTSYMGSHKGATGPVRSTPVAAAMAYAESYPKAKAVTVREVTEGPLEGLVTINYRAGFHEYVLRKGLPYVA